MTTICIFGDSIVYGTWDYEECGWVNRLRNFLDQKIIANSDVYFEVYNLGIQGDTTEGLLKRFESEVKKRISKGENVIIFEIGINDSQLITDKKILRVNPNDFKKNIQKLIKVAKEITKKIIFVGLNPIDESMVSPMPWSTSQSYKNEYIHKYNEIIKSVCKEHEIHFIEIFEKWIKLNYKDFLEDGVNPNYEGHEKIFETVKDFLIKNKLI